jgi:hypothetical protein
MLYARCFGGIRGRLIARGDLRTGIHEKEPVNAFKGSLQGLRVGEISHENIHARSEKRNGFAHVANEYPRMMALLDQEIDHFGSYVSYCASYEIFHAGSS